MSAKYAYYPGCSLHGTAKEYELSSKAVCRDLGIETEELTDWNCCGASSAHAKSHLLSLAIPARNLGIAEKMGLDIVAPCAACFSRLKVAQATLVKGGQTAMKVREAVGMNVSGSSQVLSLPEVVANVGLDVIAGKVKSPLKDLKVACYYGCLLVRPVSVGIDDPENPTLLDNIVRATGAETVEWSHKTECCGASMSVARTDVVVKLAADILGAAKEAGANCLVVACPMCQSNLDMRQAEAEKTTGREFGLPIFYFTELLGLAFGHSPDELGVPKHIVDGRSLLKGGAA